MRKFLQKKHTKIALALSIAMVFIWLALGTGTSLAWFTDVTPADRNVFNVGILEVDAEYRDAAGNWHNIEAATEVFDDDALYEPGYTQVIVLRVTNVGNVPFNYKTAVTVFNYVSGRNVFGNLFDLQEHLKFGVVSAENLSELEAAIGSREYAKETAVMGLPLNTYSTNALELNAGETAYVALVVYMPESTGNVANYYLEQPSISLGVNIKATQQGAVE